MHVFLVRIGDRLLMANTFPQSEEEARKLYDGDADKQVDLSTITGMETAKGVFARFVKAHSGPPSGLTPRVMATPGLAAALPEGVPLVDVLFSPEPLLKLAAEAESPTTNRVLKALGIDRLGPGALRVALDRGALRVGLFLSAPSPRQGVLALLDQPAFQPEVPTWVPSGILSFGQLSLDLGKAYILIRDLVISEMGEQVGNTIGQLEQQFSGYTQNDLHALLSSLGQNHYFITFPPTLAKVAQGEDTAIEAPATRQGFVWQLKDEEAWTRLVRLASGFAALTEGMVTPAQEQGFVGLRLNVEDTFSGGLFVGHGYMVVGMGPDVLEPLMSALRTPPEGAAALRGGDLLRRAAAILPPEPCIYYQVTDFDRYIKTLRETIASVLDISSSLPAQQLGLGGVDPHETAAGQEENAKFIARIKELVPSDEELEGTTGVSAGQLIVNQHGLTYRSAVEMPPQ
jgi:hypothetical protein